jgi:hypothetical protein
MKRTGALARELGIEPRLGPSGWNIDAVRFSATRRPRSQRSRYGLGTSRSPSGPDLLMYGNSVTIHPVISLGPEPL